MQIIPNYFMLQNVYNKIVRIKEIRSRRRQNGSRASS